ncbi:hypothetical protein WN944_007222 [Citrus x changshan-huyou]|uniref:Uncharacterized protein n=1 Tax=Citrus x changshan-huyou TaxID=2935761 RepID=A0AAP0QQ88_9ROSI
MGVHPTQFSQPTIYIYVNPQSPPNPKSKILVLLSIFIFISINFNFALRPKIKRKELQPLFFSYPGSRHWFANARFIFRKVKFAKKILLDLLLTNWLCQ